VDYLKIGRKALQEAAQTEAATEELARALSWLKSAGVRLMNINGQMTVGIWSDLDSAELRRALQLSGSGDLPVRYLDAPGVPDRFKLRSMPGDPVVEEVRIEMERHPEAPWEIRDRMLERMAWHRNPKLWRLSEPAPYNVSPGAVEPYDQEAFLERQYRIAHAWALWMRWRAKDPAQADHFRLTHQDENGSDLKWLLHVPGNT
jgi:hypothetical protein